MPSLNKQYLMGNLTRDPELRYTSNGTPVCNFGVAVNDPRSNQENDVTFFDCTAWRGIGETINQYKSKGDLVLIEGRSKHEEYQDKQGNTRSKHVVVVEDIQFLPSGGSGNGGSSSSSNSQTSQESEMAGVGANGAADDGFNDSDIPF